MKSKIVKHLMAEKPNWDDAGLYNCNGLIVISNGMHEGDEFSGTVLYDTNDAEYRPGDYSQSWSKRLFDREVTPMTIKFTP